jgi:hypothetical protein
VNPAKYDEKKIAFMHELFQERLAILSKKVKVALERYHTKQFEAHVREIANPLKRKAISNES